MWANTCMVCWPFSTSTRNVALGSDSVTVPSSTIASSLGFGSVDLLLGLRGVPCIDDLRSSGVAALEVADPCGPAVRRDETEKYLVSGGRTCGRGRAQGSGKSY